MPSLYTTRHEEVHLSQLDETGGIVAMTKFFHLDFVISAQGAQGRSKLYWIGSQRGQQALGVVNFQFGGGILDIH
jgi:hypothetical protein